MNKYAQSRNDEVKTVMQFQFRWFGNRVPESITFPSGKKNKVIYMREGKITFENGNSGTYSRRDDKKTQERIVSIECDKE